VIGHGCEAAFNSGFPDEPDFKVICQCGWETWGHVTAEVCAEEYADHVKEEAERYAFDIALAALTSSRAQAGASGVET
jgi:hypothetical protein